MRRGKSIRDLCTQRHRPQEDTLRKWPFRVQRERALQKPTLLVSWSWTWNLQNCEKTNFCGLSHIVGGRCSSLSWIIQWPLKVRQKLPHFSTKQTLTARADSGQGLAGRDAGWFHWSFLPKERAAVLPASSPSSRGTGWHGQGRRTSSKEMVICRSFCP